ncbi:MAG: SDR family oxidoreductase [Acidimicrobiales bacterium]|jgi:NAD(P)-dependent dehydrogenase (short-subunit alcohol dehydrogenase family)|nr:SDR family oxidoreductase [Acidimicrobiales bacterium]
MAGRLEGKVAVVTGAAAGIGAATATAFVREGAQVVVVDRDGEGAERVAAQLGPRTVAVRADVSHEQDVVAMLDAAERAFGRLDILHSNAAAAHPADLDVASTPDAAWDLAYRVTLLGAVFGARHAVPRLVAAGGGVILHTASAQAFIGDHARVAYGAAKAGVVALTRSLATTHGRAGIRCNAICPGLVVSDAARALFPPPLLDAVVRHQALDQVCEPDDVAALAVFLCSAESRCITGQAIVIDGGLSAVGSASADLAELIGYATWVPPATTDR